MKGSKKILFLFFLLGGIFLGGFIVQAQSVAELQNRISQKSDDIKQLEEEIKKYQAEIELVSKQASSLKNTLASLDLSKKKLETDLKVTQNKIDTTNLEIKQLSLDIDDKSERINESKRVISQSLSSIDKIDTDSVLESIFGAKSLAQTWHVAEELNILQARIVDRIGELKDVKTDLESNKKKTEEKKKELIDLQNDLNNQKKIIAETTKEKNSLLSTTKNIESNYKKILATKEAQKEAFEREVTDLESALKIAIDPSKIPTAGSGVLRWPLDKIITTQHFGNTPFATANPQVYNGKGHTGIDFAASIGTPVKAAMSGTVVGVANTDLIPTCYSYGKWIMVKHPNGLSTLYAHLSLQTVKIGDTVVTGQTIGYSGNTGYSTGPHLHFGVYATEGVKISLLTSSKNCRNATVPLADPKAYLNPLSFL